MNINEEITNLKKELKQINSKITKISEDSKEIKKVVATKAQAVQKRRSKRNLSYINWLDNERRMRNLISP